MRAGGIAALGATAALVAACLAVTASAGDVATFDTRLSIRDSAPAFHGKVRSDSDACVGDRKVRLYRKRRPDRPKRLLGTDRSSGNGRWQVLEPNEFTLTSGIYFARTRRIINDSTPVPTVCERDKSRKIVVD
jgi:hypothetical protein